MTFIKKYTPFLVAFLFSLLIPTFLYSFRSKSWSILPQEDRIPYTYPPLVKYSYQWTPERRNGTFEDENDNLLKKIDQKYCGNERCRFLLPVAIMEQESKSQMHFRQLAFLAGKIGRTIVLPNVHGSRLGGCLSNPFDFYYDQETWLVSNKEHFNYITMKDFKAWIKERQQAGARPSAQEIHLQGNEESRLLERETNCFQSDFDFSDRPISSYQIPDLLRPKKKNKMNITRIMMSVLSDEARRHEYLGYSDKPVDVINILYDRR
ncbi:hypothetical protein G6F56_011893 [Rhizopus delemar]|nr:hypothetical protein G6F56_011893 [Rhizopus delemar]